MDVFASSLLTRSRCVPVKQCETRLIGLVLAAAQGDRLRLHHRRRIRQLIRQLRTENEAAHSLCKLTISEVAPRFNDLNVLYHLVSIHVSQTGRMSRIHLHELDTVFGHLGVSITYISDCVISPSPPSRATYATTQHIHDWHNSQE